MNFICQIIAFQQEEIILFVFPPPQKKRSPLEEATPVKSRPIRDTNQSKSSPTQDQIWQ